MNAGVRAPAAILFLVLSLSSCTTVGVAGVGEQVRGGETEFYHGWVRVEGRRVELSVFRITEPHFSVVVGMGAAEAEDEAEAEPEAGGVLVGANPYRYGAPTGGEPVEPTGPIEPTGPVEPVGLVIREGATLAPAEPRYWGVGGGDDRSLRMFSQTAPPPGLHWGVSGFFPLLQDGHNVAGTFPGATLRAARVAIAWGDSPAEGVLVIATSGSVPWRRGLTTEELARLLLSLGATNALNLDGGRAAAILSSKARRLPRHPVPTAAGPVLLQLLVPAQGNPNR